MKNQTIKYFKDRLLDKKEQAKRTLVAQEEDGLHKPLKDYYNSLSTYDNHPADLGTETFEMEMEFSLEESEKRELKDIDDALNRIQSGTYGVCERCGKKIGYQRLNTVPATRYCMDCTEDTTIMGLDEKLETRPVEEEVLMYPFGDEELDVVGDVRTDDEDIYQGVARYNKTEEKNMALDWYDNNMYDPENSGYVQKVEEISNEQYKKQLE